MDVIPGNVLYTDELRSLLIGQLRRINAMLLSSWHLRAVQPLVDCEFRILDQLIELDGVLDRPDAPNT